jgi:hypothetical protein
LRTVDKLLQLLHRGGSGAASGPAPKIGLRVVNEGCICLFELCQ